MINNWIHFWGNNKIFEDSKTFVLKNVLLLIGTDATKGYYQCIKIYALKMANTSCMLTK